MKVEDLTDDQVQAIAELLETARQELEDRRGGPDLVRELFGGIELLSLANTRGLLGELASLVFIAPESGSGAFLGTVRLEGTRGHLGIYVSPEARSEGLGTALFREVLAAARREGARSFDVLVLPGDRPMKQICENAGLKARKLTMALNDAPHEPADAEVGEES